MMSRAADLRCLLGTLLASIVIANPHYQIFTELAFVGIAADQWSDMERVFLKEIIAEHTGAYCGANGDQICTSADVRMDPVGSRRAVAAQDLSVYMYTSEAVKSGMKALKEYVSQPDIVASDIRAKGGNLTNVTNVIVLTGPESNLDETGTESNIIGVVVGCSVAGFFLIVLSVVIYYQMHKDSFHVPLEETGGPARPTAIDMGPFDGVDASKQPSPAIDNENAPALVAASPVRYIGDP